jgi:hypothetical protein
MKLLTVPLSALLALAAWASADEVLRISEFMANNNGPLLDEDGEASDWIEIHNAGTNTVNLDGWFLTDKSSELDQWQFPATNLAANAYMVVFASDKNHRVPGQPLHTNFKLNDGGEYLALVKPDRSTIAFAYAPNFPGQVPGVSYGIPVEQTATTLLSNGAPAKLLIPANDALGVSSTQLGRMSSRESASRRTGKARSFRCRSLIPSPSSPAHRARTTGTMVTGTARRIAMVSMPMTSFSRSPTTAALTARTISGPDRYGIGLGATRPSPRCGTRAAIRPAATVSRVARTTGPPAAT